MCGWPYADLRPDRPDQSTVRHDHTVDKSVTRRAQVAALLSCKERIEWKGVAIPAIEGPSNAEQEAAGRGILADVDVMY